MQVRNWVLVLTVVGLLATTAVCEPAKDDKDNAPTEKAAPTEVPAVKNAPAKSSNVTSEDTPKDAPKEASEETTPEAPDTPEEKNATESDSEEQQTPSEDKKDEEKTSEETSKNSTQTEEEKYLAEYYDDFDFDDIFDYGDDYEGYFNDDYFNFYGGYDGDEYEGDYYQDYDEYYMYDGLYDDYYYDDYYKTYDDADYYDYEYYGDYGYYGVYDEDGYKMDMEDVYDKYDYEYDYFMFDEDKCETNDKGEIVFNASMNICDVQVTGADKHASQLDGGIDGKYSLAGCMNGRPKYVRYEPAGKERVLWFSNMFGDWDISKGSEPDEEDILVYGGEGLDEERPNFVNPSAWAIAADVVSDDQDRLELFEDYLSVDLQVTCADGSMLDRPERSTMGKQPLLTDEEMESQYRMIYQKYSRKSPEPSINFAMVVTIVFLGMGVVLGLPYMMARRTDSSGKTLWRRYQEEQKKRVGKD